MEEDRRDHGHAWIILLSSIVCNTLFAAVCLCPPLFLVNFTNAFQLSTYQAGWIVSINGFLVSIGAVAGGILIESFGCKAIGFVGALIGCVIHVISSQLYHIILFILAYSILSGFCVALTRLPPVVIIQTYFNKKRPFATGVSLTGYSIGVFAGLPFIAFLIEYYGWRGALMLVGGVCLNMCFLMLTFSPIKGPSTCDDKFNKDERTNRCKETLTDCGILKDIKFLMVAISFALFQFGADTMFKLSTPRAELDMDVDKITASSVISIMSITGVISRCITSVLANLKCVSSLLLYGLSVLLGGGIIIISSFVQNFTVSIVAAAFYGVCFGMATTLLTVVLVDLLGVEKISRAQGFVSGMTGVIFLTTIPYGGWVYDTLHSFSTAYFTAGIIQCAGGAIAVTLFFKERRKEDKQQSPKEQGKHKIEDIHIKSLQAAKLTPAIALGSVQSLSSLS